MPNPNNTSSSQLLWMYSTILSNALGSFMFFNTIFAPRATLNATTIWIVWYRQVFRIPFVLHAVVVESAFVALLHCYFHFMWKWTLLWLLGLDMVVIYACYLVPLIGRYVDHEKGLRPGKPPLNEMAVPMGTILHLALFVNSFAITDIWSNSCRDHPDFEMQFFLGLTLIMESLVYLFYFHKHSEMV